MTLRNMSAAIAMAMDSAAASQKITMIGDSAPSVYFDRDLEQIKKKTYDIKYPELRGRDFVPSSPEPVPPGADRFTFRTFDIAGLWNVITKVGQNLPLANLFGTEQTGVVETIGNAAGWTMDDLRRAAFMGRPLSGEQMRAAALILERGIDEIIAFGLVSRGQPLVRGLLNIVNASSGTVATSTGGHTTWDDKLGEDPNLVLADIFSAFNATKTLTKETETPNTLLLPPSAMRLLQQRNRSGATDRTLIEELRAKLPAVTRIDEWNRLETAGSGNTRRAVLYTADQNHLWFEIPQELEIGAVLQKDHFAWEVPVTARIGGVVCPYPLSVRYFDGF